MGPFKMNIKSRKWKFYIAIEIKYSKLVLYNIKNVI